MKPNFYSWNSVKKEKSLQFVDDITDELINNFTFDAIIDFFRLKSGLPSATLLSDLISNQPFIPKIPDELSNVFFESSKLNFINDCPLCHQIVNDRNFIDHWSENCLWFQKNDDEALKSYVFQYFNDSNKKE